MTEIMYDVYLSHAMTREYLVLLIKKMQMLTASRTKNRFNLTVWTQVLATRVLFDSSTRAVGVAYLKDGSEQQVLAAI